MLMKDTHFALVLALAREAGLSISDGLLLAWASAAVDVHFQVKWWNFWWSRIGMDYHFVPGDGDNPLIVTAGSKCAEALLARARSILENGLALHAYMDTYSHAGFVGLRSKINCPPVWDRKLQWPVYGHNAYLTRPDDIGKTWTDTRTNHVRNNYKRFKPGIERVARYLGLDSIPAKIASGMLMWDYDSRKARWFEIAGYPDVSFTRLDKKMWPLHKAEFQHAARRQKAFVEKWLKKKGGMIGGASYTI